MISWSALESHSTNSNELLSNADYITKDQIHDYLDTDGPNSITLCWNVTFYSNKGKSFLNSVSTI